MVVYFVFGDCEAFESVVVAWEEESVAMTLKISSSAIVESEL